MSAVVREDELDDDDYQVREVYAKFGLAVYHSQVLESSLTTLLAVAKGATTSGFTVHDYDDVLESASVKTMGAILSLLKPFLDNDAPLPDDLRRGLLTRNYLVHRFFAAHAVGFTHMDGRERMLGELFKATEDFIRLDERLEPVMDRFLASRGVDPEMKRNFIRDAAIELLEREGIATNGSQYSQYTQE